MQVLAAIWSNLFRLASFIFLRIIPYSFGKFVLPALYSLYLSSVYLSSAPREPVNPEKSDETKPQAKTKNSVLGDVLTIIFTLPTSIRRLRLASLTINSLLFLAVVDLTAEPYYNNASDVIFTRVGAVYPDSVKIAVRYPGITDPLYVVWRQSRAQLWSLGPEFNLTEENDWVSTVTLSQLYPSTEYEYTLAASNGSILSYPAEPLHFKTFPDPRLHTGSNFRFLVSSCIKPNFPYAPLHGNRIKGFDLLADYLWPQLPGPDTAVNETSAEDASPEVSTNETVVNQELAVSAPDPEFMLFLGDFVYADVPFYFGDDKEAYRRLYRRNYKSPSFRKVYERLPIIHAYDDHEIINNFAGQSGDGAPFLNAVNPFKLYNSETNYDSLDEGQHYYNFTYGSDAAFFVMDTRRHRSKPEEVEPVSRTMLGDKQLAAFYNWLTKVNSTTTFKFVVTSVPFTSLWTYDAQIDSWAAYEHEKAAILGALSTVPNVIILSGDRHEFAAIEFNSPDVSKHQVVEFSTSPLSMFYIPIIKSLRSASEETVSRVRKLVTTDEEGLESIEHVIEEIPKERVFKYQPIGNYKVSAIEVDTRDQDHPLLHLEVLIDGTVQYKHTIEGVPVKWVSSTAIGAFIPQGFKGVFDKIGLSPGKWF